MEANNKAILIENCYLTLNVATKPPRALTIYFCQEIFHKNSYIINNIFVLF